VGYLPPIYPAQAVLGRAALGAGPDRRC